MLSLRWRIHGVHGWSFQAVDSKWVWSYLCLQRGVGGSAEQAKTPDRKWKDWGAPAWWCPKCQRPFHQAQCNDGSSPPSSRKGKDGPFGPDSRWAPEGHGLWDHWFWVPPWKLGCYPHMDLMYWLWQSFCKPFFANRVIELESSTQICIVIISWLTFWFWQSCLSMLARTDFEGGEPTIYQNKVLYSMWCKVVRPLIPGMQEPGHARLESPALSTPGDVEPSKNEEVLFWWS